MAVFRLQDLDLQNNREESNLYLRANVVMSNRHTIGKRMAKFDISIGPTPAGRIVFRLYDNVVPKVAKNFRELSTG